MVTPRITMLKEKRLVGKCLGMSLLNDKTGELWNGFIPLVNTISNKSTEDKISLQLYPNTYFDSFDPNLGFVKWAAVEVTDFKGMPEDFETFVLAGGLYAVFDYRGSSADKRIFEYIYTRWLPNSGYRLDDRPHFEVLGEKYKNNDPDSEEEIWIPIQPR